MPRISLLLTAALALVLALAPGSAPGADDSRPSSVDPDSGGIVPACWSPQAFDPPQSLGDAGGSTSAAPVMAWNGTDYGSLMMSDYSGPRFLHVFADGSPSLPPTFLPSLPPGTSGYLNIYDRPALVWTGSGYGAAWTYRDTTASRYLVAFALLSPDGVVQGAVQRASFVGVAPTADASAPAIGWNATTGSFLVVWQDSRSGNNDIYGSVFKGSGSLSNVGAHDLLMSRDGSGNPLAGNQQNPTVASSPAGNSLVLVAWEDGRGSPSQIWGRTLNLYTDGSSGWFGPEYQLTSSTSGAGEPSLTATPTSYGLAWQDTRNSVYDIYSARLDGYYGYRVSSELRVTSNPSAYAFWPSIAWTGSEFGISFSWGASGLGSDLFLARVSSTATLLAAPAQITTGLTTSSTFPSSLAFGVADYVCGVSGYGGSGHFGVAIGCNWDGQAPSCATNVRVVAANWSSVTLAWDPVSDPDGNDIAYYDVRRDGSSVGHTSSTQLTVTGLAPGTSSQYEVQPVDADQRRPTSCTPITFAPPARQDLCPTPRPLGSGVSVGGFLYCQVAIAANPTDFAIAWSDSGGLYFQRFQPDGRPRSAKVLVTPGDGYTSWYGPGLVWNGSGYGIAWATNGAFSFAKLNGDGAMISAPVSLVTAASPSQFLNFPIGLAWNGSKYGAVWEDYRNNATTGSDVYAAIVNADGTVGMADIVVTNAAGNQRQPSIVWSPYASRFVVAYGNEAPTTPDTIETVRIDPTAGTADLPSTVIAPPAGGAYRPSLACDGYYLGLTWQDTRTGGSQIFYDLLPPSGASAYYLHILLTQKNNSGYNSHLVSAGAGAGSGNFDVVWNDTRDGTSRIYFQKVLYGYYPSDENVAVSPAAFGLQLPRLGISSTGMLVASPQVSPYGPGALYTLGCVSDATPPTCPTNLAAQVSGSTSVQLSWSAGSDTDSGVDRYVVVRNGIDVGQTTQTTFTDTVVAGATYAYSVQPVNWAGVRNTTCDQLVSATTAPIAGSCVQPTPGAPSQPLGGARVNHGNPIVWNGSSFATLWKDEADGNLYFEKLYLDGRVIAGSKVTVATGLDTIVSYGPSMVWNGAGYGVAWYDDGTKLVWFQRLDAGGVPLGSPTQVSSSAQTTTYYALESTIGLAWSGSGYAVVWNDGRSSGTSGADILATLLKSDGTIDGPSGAWHDLAVSSDPANQYLPVVIWSRFDGSGRYFVAWQDNTPGVPSSIYGARINPADGTVSARIPLVTTGNVFGAGEPTLVSADSSTTGLGLAWVDARDWDTSNAIYFARLGVSGGRATGDVRISKDSIVAYHPRLLWNGAEFGVLWNDSHTGVSEIWYDRIDGNGNPVSQPVQVTNGAEQHLPRGAWGGPGFLVTSHPYNGNTGGPNIVTGLGCAVDQTPPSCPGNLLVYNVSGSSATVSWSPSGDPESGLAEYVLYRQNAELVRTTATQYTDTGLSPTGTYNYMVQPVNGNGVQNLGCTSSVYVKMGSSLALTLTMSKSNPDAALAWNNVNLNSYNIFRGTRPDVMSLEGATANTAAVDPNVLVDGLDYFYTVDDPGQ